MEIGTCPTTSYSHQEDWKASILGWRLERIVVVAQYMIYFKNIMDVFAMRGEGDYFPKNLKSDQFWDIILWNHHKVAI